MKYRRFETSEEFLAWLESHVEYNRQIEESEAAIERGDLGEPVATADLRRKLRES